MFFSKIFSMVLLLVSISLFGFSALTLEPLTNLNSQENLLMGESDFESTYSDTPKIDTIFHHRKTPKARKYFEVMEMQPMYFNVRLEKIRNLSMQPRCVDR